jgi:hypothetical protein
MGRKIQQPLTMKYVKLKTDIEGYYVTLTEGSSFYPNEPYQGFNEDGTFTICQGFGVYLDLQPNEFEILEK